VARTAPRPEPPLGPNGPEVGAKEVLERLTWLGDARHSLKRFLGLGLGVFFYLGLDFILSYFF
jgi:hypothetical protein